MAENLFLRLGHKADGTEHIQWMMLDEVSGIVRFRGEGSPEEFADLAENLSYSGQAFVMLQAADVLLTEATIPSKQQRQILQAVPFMVEENIAADVEDCHFAVGPRSQNGKVSVAVVDRDYMRHVTDFLKANVIYPGNVSVDVLMVSGDASCNVLIDDQQALFKFEGNAGLGIDLDALPLTLDLLEANQKQSLKVQVNPAERDAVSLLLNQIGAEQETEIDVQELEYSAFESLCRNFNRDALNLLQGEFKLETKKTTRNGAWRAVAILAACAFGLHLSVVMGQGIYLDVKAQQLDAELRQLYADIYPNDRNVRDIRRRWQNHLRGAGGSSDSDFISLFYETARHLPGSNLQLNNVNFNESRGDLVLQLESNRSEQLIAFAETLNKLGLESEIGTINQADDAVRGSVKVKAAGGS